MQQQSLSRRAALCVAGIAVVATTVGWPALADPNLPLKRGAKLVRTQTASVTTNGSYSDLFVPGRVTFTLDFAVESGRELTFGVITGAQFQQVGQGRKMSGEPMINAKIVGIGSRSVALTRGNYAIVIVNYDSRPTKITYRASYVGN